MKIRCKYLLATDLQQNIFVAKNLVAILFPLAIGCKKSNGFATEIFGCYVTTNFTFVAKPQRSKDIELVEVVATPLQISNILATVLLQYHCNFCYNFIANV